MNRQQTKSINQELAWLAMITALQGIFLWLNQVYPLFGYWLTYLLPFFTIMVILTTTKKGLLIYLATSLMLTFILIQPFIETILFYLLPAWFLGFGYSWALKKKTTLLSLLLFLSIIQLFILIMVRTLSFALYETDLLTFLYLFLNIQNASRIAMLDPLALYTIALLQVLISLLLMLPLLERFKLTLDYRLFFNRIESMTFIGLFVLTIAIAFIIPPMTFYILGPLTLLAVYGYIYFFMKPSYFDAYWLMLGIILYPFLNAAMNPLINPPYKLLSVILLAIGPLTLVIVKSFIQKKKNPLI